MTWLADLPPGETSEETEWDRFARIQPKTFGAIAGLVSAAWEEVDPVVLELCRLRIATVLRYGAELDRRSAKAKAAGLTETKVGDLARWLTSPEFSDAERACLALTEQFVIDANGVTDALVEDVTRHLGAAGCYSFVQALSAVETYQRACLALGIETTPGVDELATWARAHQAEPPDKKQADKKQTEMK